MIPRTEKDNEGKELVVTVLVENSRASGLLNEHGLSLYVKYGSQRLLLDFGQSNAFARNAETLGVDLGEVDLAVLSHAHYDHADGMGTFLERNEHATVFLSESCAEDCWSTKAGTTTPHYIGIRKGLMEQHRKRLRFVPKNKVTTISPGIHVVPHSTPGLDEAGKEAGMLREAKGTWRPDDYAHEMSLVVELGPAGDEALVVFSSCTHAGLSVVMDEVRRAFPQRSTAAFVGGLHLVHAGDDEILRVADAIQAHAVKRLYTGHCTGKRAIELLSQRLHHTVYVLHPGLVFDLPFCQKGSCPF